MCKYKVGLNAHGGEQIHRVCYCEAFACAVMWTTIRLVLSLILIIYTDDCIMATDRSEELENAVRELAMTFEITDKGNVDEYLGVKVKKKDDGSFKLSNHY